MSIRDFAKHHFRHFNSAALVAAAQEWVDFLDKDGKMMVTLAGAMSTAEIGLSLAEMIRFDKVHAIACTGANLEEDLYNLVAHDHYEMVPHYRDLTPEDEKEILKRKFNRVTDTCIPEEYAMRVLYDEVLKLWQEAQEKNERYFPHEYIFELIRRETFKDQYQIDSKDSWLVAACEKDLPIYVPGWEDSTLGNQMVASVKQGLLKGYQHLKTGPEYMDHLIDWYSSQVKEHPIGFFQIGGGIAGDFPICVVPLIRQDMHLDVPLWAYFCQISDSTTSYGSYSGAIPNEKITWEKIDSITPRFVIESDATIVAPLIFSYVLG